MDGIIAQRICNLGKIHLFITDKLLGCINLHQRKIVDNTTASIVSEQLLQQRTPYQIVPANPLYGKLFINIFLHISNNIIKKDARQCI